MAKKKKVTIKTKAPTGLTLARSGGTFTATWKCSDRDYKDGQSLGWRTYQPKATKWTWPKIGASVRRYAWSIDPKKFYPYTSVYLKSVQYGVAGNCARWENSKNIYYPSKSSYTQKSFTIAPPGAPSLSNASSDQFTNVRTYSWSYAVNATNSQWFANIEYQTMIVKNSNVTDGSKLSWNSKQTGWQDGVVGASGSKTITEDSTSLATASWTR